MFVLKSKYERLEMMYLQIRAILEIHKANIQFLQLELAEYREKGNKSPFSDADIQRLIQLCHPDKHNGKQMAVEMTQKLLALKK